MLKLDLQYFGGRGASGTLKNPNGKVAKGRNTGGSGGDNKEPTYEEKQADRETILNRLVNEAREKYADSILSDDKERKLREQILKDFREEIGISEYAADRYLSKIKLSDNEYDGKTYFKDSDGKTQNLQLNGNTNFGLVKRDGGKANIYVVIAGKEQGVREVKAVEANVYNIDGRDIAIHKPYGASGRGTGYHVTDVATGLSVSSKFYGSKEKALADVRNSNIVSVVKGTDFNKYNSRASLNQFRAIQQKLDEEKNRKKR